MHLHKQRAGLLGEDAALRSDDATSSDDVEASAAGATAAAFEREPRRSSELEYHVAPQVKYGWLAAYFLLSLLLTLYNKFVLQFFPYPWLLTSLHAAFSTLGTSSLLGLGHFRLSKIDHRGNIVLVAFSLLVTLNIAMSNLSLAVVSVPFYQVMRMTCPLFTILIYRLYYSRTYSTATYLSLLPVIFGTALTTVGEYRFSDLGFLLTLGGVVLAARILTGSLALPAIEVLCRTSPLAAAQAFICAVFAGEVRQLTSMGTALGQVGFVSACAFLAGNGLLAFVLNVSSFQTNKLAGALTMTVCGNLKQCLTVLLGIICFDVGVNLTNGFGMAVTMIGAAMYSKAELDAKRRKAQEAAEKSSDDLVGLDSQPGLLRSLFGRLSRRTAILLSLVVFSPLSLFLLQSQLDADVMTYISSQPLQTGRFHLLMPANNPHLNLCRAMLSSAVLRYPPPVLVGWNATGEMDASKTHLAKIRTVHRYLQNLPAEQDDDLVLMVDAYDVLFQLPPDILIERYFAINDAANARLAKRYKVGLEEAQKRGLRQTILLGPDKTCWPWDENRPGCWALEPSALAPGIFGPFSDNGDIKYMRPRWVNSGTIMGPVGDMRNLFAATMEEIRRSYNPENIVRESDQLYMADVLGAQEYSRSQEFGIAIEGPEAKIIPPLAPGQRVELHTGIEYESQLFQTYAGYEDFVEQLVYNRSGYSTEVTRNATWDPEFKAFWLSLGPKLRKSLSKLYNALPPASRRLPATKMLQSVGLGTNIVTRQVYVIFHCTGITMKSYLDQMWPQLWFYPFIRALFETSVRAVRAGEPISSSAIRGRTWTYARTYPLSEEVHGSEGGAWADEDGGWVRWDDVCGEHEESLFGRRMPTM